MEGCAGKSNDNRSLDSDLNDIQLDRRLTGNKKGLQLKKLQPLAFTGAETRI